MTDQLADLRLRYNHPDAPFEVSFRDEPRFAATAVKITTKPLSVGSVLSDEATLRFPESIEYLLDDMRRMLVSNIINEWELEKEIRDREDRAVFEALQKMTEQLRHRPLDTGAVFDAMRVAIDTWRGDE